MSCYDILDRLIQQAQACPGGHNRWCTKGYDLWLQNLANGRERRQEFLELYPFRGSPAEITTLTSSEVYDRGSKNTFFKGIGWDLKWLGAINSPGLPRAFASAAGPDLGRFKELLAIALSDDIRLADKIDAKWELIPGFRGDKHIAKKIVATYSARRLRFYLATAPSNLGPRSVAA